jgi:hypothetical protein
MLSRPFRGLPKRRLVTLLILFLLLEAALGGGLYVNNRPVASAAPPPPAPIYRGPVVLKVQNTPRTVILGHKETFSVQLKGLKRVILTYTVAYPDGKTDSYKVLTDITGFSKLRIPVTFRPQHGNRDTIGISVSYGTTLEAATRFAVQLPGKKK